MATNHLRSLALIGVISLTSCFSRPALMTFNDYDKVQVGTPIADLRSEIGRPYAIHHKDNGTDEYEYIERVNTGNNLVSENHYFLIAKNGKVIGKYVTRERPPAYDLIYQDDPNYPNYP
jgi:hypothetical protein